MANFAQELQISRGLTAVIGSGGKTTLIAVLAHELSQRGSVIVATSTHIRRPDAWPVLRQTGTVRGVICVGTDAENGKLTAPMQSFSELARCADFVLVEADGSKELPLKAHAAHEPVIPENAAQVICMVGASGLGKPVREAVHRPELFQALTGSNIASPQAVARLLQREGLHSRVFINQVDSPQREALARALASELSCPVTLGSLKRGEIICL